MCQIDGADSISSLDVSTTNSGANESFLNSDNEIHPENSPIKLTPISKPKRKDLNILKATSLPLICALNARSLYNKSKNFKTFLTELGVEVAIVSETWERDEQSLKQLLNTENLKVESYCRPKVIANRQPGGGCAIVYNENRFTALPQYISVPKGVEACWLVLKPKDTSALIKYIAIGSIYISPNSKYKTATIDHVIDSIHLLRSKYDDQIKFLIAGDVNRMKVDRILDAYGPLRQIISAGTRLSAILENVLTDLHTVYQPPDYLSPLQVDADQIGEDSDHRIIMIHPIQINHKRKYSKKTVFTRPLPQSGIDKLSEFFAMHNWSEVFDEEDIDKKVGNFHATLRLKLDEFFPEKSMTVSVLDKKWMNPKLKSLNRKIKREFYKNRKSIKWRKIKKFKVL